MSKSKAETRDRSSAVSELQHAAVVGEIGCRDSRRASAATSVTVTGAARRRSLKDEGHCASSAVRSATSAPAPSSVQRSTAVRLRLLLRSARSWRRAAVEPQSRCRVRSVRLWPAARAMLQSPSVPRKLSPTSSAVSVRLQRTKAASAAAPSLPIPWPRRIRLRSSPPRPLCSRRPGGPRPEVSCSNRPADRKMRSQ